MKKSRYLRKVSTILWKLGFKFNFVFVKIRINYLNQKF